MPVSASRIQKQLAQWAQRFPVDPIPKEALTELDALRQSAGSHWRSMGVPSWSFSRPSILALLLDTGVEARQACLPSIATPVKFVREAALQANAPLASHDLLTQAGVPLLNTKRLGTVLHDCMRSGHLQSLDVLLEHFPEAVRAALVDPEGLPASGIEIFLARHSTQVPLLEWLGSHGAPLREAFLKGPYRDEPAIVNFMTPVLADIEAKNLAHKTPSAPPSFSHPRL